MDEFVGVCREQSDLNADYRAMVKEALFLPWCLEKRFLEANKQKGQETSWESFEKLTQYYGLIAM